MACHPSRRNFTASDKRRLLQGRQNHKLLLVHCVLCELCQLGTPAIHLVESMSLTAQAGAVTGTIAAFVEGPIDFYKSQIQVQIIRSRADPNYKRMRAC